MKLCKEPKFSSLFHLLFYLFPVSVIVVTLVATQADYCRGENASETIDFGRRTRTTIANWNVTTAYLVAVSKLISFHQRLVECVKHDAQHGQVFTLLTPDHGFSFIGNRFLNNQSAVWESVSWWCQRDMISSRNQLGFDRVVIELGSSWFIFKILFLIDDYTKA